MHLHFHSHLFKIFFAAFVFAVFFCSYFDFVLSYIVRKYIIIKASSMPRMMRLHWIVKNALNSRLKTQLIITSLHITKWCDTYGKRKKRIENTHFCINPLDYNVDDYDYVSDTILHKFFLYILCHYTYNMRVWKCIFAFMITNYFFSYHVRSWIHIENYESFLFCYLLWQKKISFEIASY